MRDLDSAGYGLAPVAQPQTPYRPSQLAGCRSVLANLAGWTKIRRGGTGLAVLLLAGLHTSAACWAWQSRRQQMPIPAKAPVYVSDNAPTPARPQATVTSDARESKPTVAPTAAAEAKPTVAPTVALPTLATSPTPAQSPTVATPAETTLPPAKMPTMQAAPARQQALPSSTRDVVVPASGALTGDPAHDLFDNAFAPTMPNRRAATAGEAGQPRPAVTVAAPAESDQTTVAETAPAESQPSVAPQAQPTNNPPRTPSVVTGDSTPPTAVANDLPRGGNSASLLGEGVTLPTPMQEPEPSVATPPPTATVSDAPPVPQAPNHAIATAQPRTEQKLNLLGLLPEIEAEAASFNGAQPGRSTQAEVQKHWGAPIDIVKDGPAEMWVYQIQPFRRIEMQFVGGIVDSIVVFLERPVAAEKLAKQLSLHKIQTVEVSDPTGRALGRTFPERGVLFSYELKAGQHMVGQILLEPVHAQPYVLRARETATHKIEQKLADLNAAALFAKHDGEAFWLRAKLLLASGALKDAQDSVRRAIEIEPNRPEFRLTLAECLAADGLYADAAELLSTVLSEENIPPVLRARGFYLQGNLLAWGPDHQYQQAIKSHMQAIETAVPLASSQEVRIRREAKRVLIDSHLAVAADIGRGNWKRKNEVVPKWIERAVEFANEMMQNDGGDAELMLRVAEQALVAASGFKSDIDTALMLKDAQRAADKALENTDDVLWTQQVHWRLGLAFRHALEIEHTRSQPEEALLYAQAARRYMEQSDTYRHDCFQARRELGWLYFRTGAVHALHQQDHQSAAAMYEQALAMFAPTMRATQVESSLFGEALVSMGVTLWEVGQHREAVEVTRQGATVVEHAVARKAAPKNSLAVPYGNLATMHKAMGKTEQARDLLELAKEHQGTQHR